MHLLAPSITSATGLAAGALLSAVWQGTVLAIAIALCLRLLPGLTATLRSLIWTAALLVIVALHLGPLVNGAAPVTQLGHTSGAVHSLHLNSLWATTLVCLWAALSLLRLISLARCGIRLQGIARRSTPLSTDPALATLLLQDSRQIQLCVSDEVDRPCVLGFLAPRILLPPGLAETFHPSELAHVIVHEMEHLRRRDHWLNLACKLALALFPLNPALLWVERRIAVERELACDDGVLRQTAARKAYATCLASLAEHAMVRRGLALALGAWERHSELTRRVHRILARPEAAMGRTQAALAATVLFLGLAGGATFLTRCPQLVSFAPAPASTAHIASEETANFNSLQTSHTASLRVASAAATRPAALVQTSMVMDRPPQSTSTTTHRRAVANRVKHPSRGLAPRPSWLTLTRYRQETGSARLVLTNTQFSEPTYAAVPWLNGWLIVQL